MKEHQGLPNVIICITSLILKIIVSSFYIRSEPFKYCST